MHLFYNVDTDKIPKITRRNFTMKKFTKILAVLMTVCLLFGVVAAFGTSAKVASTKESVLFVKANYNSDGTMPTPTNRYYAAFDKLLPATPTTITVTKDGVGSHEYIDSMTVGGSGGQRFQIKSSPALKAYPAGLNHVQLDGGEGYLAIRKVPGSFRITDASGALSTTGLTHTSDRTFSVSAPEWYFGITHASQGKTYADTPSEQQHLNLVDFAVVDFDYGTDRWAYKVDGVWQTGETVPANADPESVKPGYAFGVMDICYNTLSGSAAKSTVTERNSGIIRVSVCQDAVTGVYFLSDTNSPTKDTEYNEGTDILLSNQPGVLDHFTYVFDVTTNAAAITGVDVHIYVNGEYFCTKTLTISGYDNMVLQSIYVYPTELGTPAADMTDGSLVKENDRYSVVYDNIVTNYYKNYVDASNTGYQYYETANGSYGLDDFFASESVYKSVNLASCPDTLYGIYEQRDDAIAIIDGAKHKVLGSSVDLGDMISNNSTVTLPAGKAFTASPAADVASFNVTLGDGATLTTKSGAYKAVESDGTYAFTKIATKANVSLFTDMAFNLYVPADAGFTAEGFLDGTVTIEDVDYKQYTWNPALASFDSQAVTLNYGSVSSEITLDVVKYATLVAGEFDCGTVEAKLAYEIMDYKAAVAEYLDSDFDAANVASLQAFYALYSEHADCNCGSAAEIDNAAINKGILEGKTFSFLLSDDNKFSIALGGFTAGENVSVSIGAGADAYSATVTADADGDVVFNDVNAALLRYTFSVTATAGAGEYRLSSYIAALGAGAEKDLAVAMYEYSLAVYNFKTAPIN